MLGLVVWPGLHSVDFVVPGHKYRNCKTYFWAMRTRTLLLTLVASFCDASTFVGAGRLFSAHVTGNFIVLAYDLVHGADRHEWSKLLAFPMFFSAVMIAAI